MKGGGIRVSIIVAVDLHSTIGNSKKEGGLPWPHHKKDMQRFVDITRGKPVIVGHTSYKFVPERFRPFKGRPTIVVSRDIESTAEKYEAEEKRLGKGEHAIIAGSPDAALGIAVAIAEENGLGEVIIAGGETIYRYFLEKDLVDRIYLTQVFGEFEGDAKFPVNPCGNDWRLANLPVRIEPEGENEYRLVMSTLDRKPR